MFVFFAWNTTGQSTRGTLNNPVSVWLNPKLEPVCTVAWICMCRCNPPGLYILKTGRDSCITKCRGLFGMTKQAPNIYPTNEKKRNWTSCYIFPNWCRRRCITWFVRSNSSHLKAGKIFLLCVHCMRCIFPSSKSELHTAEGFSLIGTWADREKRSCFGACWPGWPSGK